MHRHTVVTVLGTSPQEGLDTVYGDGSFGPLCFRGNDVAATRPGLAQFLAYPAHVGSSLLTSSTTTNGPQSVSHSEEHPCGDSLRPQPKSTLVDSIFTVLDTTHGVQTFTGDPAWSTAEYLRRAVGTAALPASCAPHMLTFELACLPSPQILLSQETAGVAANTVVVDLTPFGGIIAVRAVVPGWSVLDLLVGLDTDTLAIPPLARLQDATCVCLVNRVIADPRTALETSAEVVQFYLLRVTSPEAQPTHPSTSPVAFAPVHGLDDASDTPVAGSSQQLSQIRPAASTIHETVVRLPEGEGRYTIIGTVEGAINRWRAPDWEAHKCLKIALASAPCRGPHLSAQIMCHPLPTLFVPQILVSRASEHLGWRTIALDLRPIARSSRHRDPAWHYHWQALRVWQFPF